MKKTPFFIVDVFTEKKYAGNQLAVFRKAEEGAGGIRVAVGGRCITVARGEFL